MIFKAKITNVSLDKERLLFNVTFSSEAIPKLTYVHTFHLDRKIDLKILTKLMDYAIVPFINNLENSEIIALVY